MISEFASEPSEQGEFDSFNFDEIFCDEFDINFEWNAVDKCLFKLRTLPAVDLN